MLTILCKYWKYRNVTSTLSLCSWGICHSSR